MDQIAAFAETYSRITLSLDFSDTRRELITDGFDIAIRMGPKSKNSATSRTLFQVQRRLVASTAYLATRPKANDPTQLLDWRWLVLTPAQKVPVAFRKSDGKRLTIKPGARMNTNDAQALYQPARAGAGLAIVPDFLAEDDVASGGVEYVLPEWKLDPIDVFAVWPANAPKQGLVQLALDALSGSWAKP